MKVRKIECLTLVCICIIGCSIEAPPKSALKKTGRRSGDEGSWRAEGRAVPVSLDSLGLRVRELTEALRLERSHRRSLATSVVGLAQRIVQLESDRHTMQWLIEQSREVREREMNRRDVATQTGEPPAVDGDGQEGDE